MGGSLIEAATTRIGSGVHSEAPSVGIVQCQRTSRFVIVIIPTSSTLQVAAPHHYRFKLQPLEPHEPVRS